MKELEKLNLEKTNKFWPFLKQRDYDMNNNQLRSPYLTIRRCAIASLVIECQKREKEKLNAS